MERLVSYSACMCHVKRSAVSTKSYSITRRRPTFDPWTLPSLTLLRGWHWDVFNSYDAHSQLIVLGFAKLCVTTGNFVEMSKYWGDPGSVEVGLYLYRGPTAVCTVCVCVRLPFRFFDVSLFFSLYFLPIYWRILFRRLIYNLSTWSQILNIHDPFSNQTELGPTGPFPCPELISSRYRCDCIVRSVGLLQSRSSRTQASNYRTKDKQWENSQIYLPWNCTWDELNEYSTLWKAVANVGSTINLPTTGQTQCHLSELVSQLIWQFMAIPGISLSDSMSL
jgi:hypothetical protein